MSREEPGIQGTAILPRDAESAFCFGWKPGLFGSGRPASPGWDMRAEDADSRGCPVHGDSRNGPRTEKPFIAPVPADAFDNELIFKTLTEIIAGNTVQIPVYDFVSHSR